ncbi:hypothetical protein M406DRAFT_325616 [Cryphonectria parasitica EP155]|uniref:Uncharacterized protein n=1 Tax=Cryphonectria parasitica (strain ATCC 38755 / EP155) TaxID=660469 RepID=A0A9P4YBS6_CRYP1|nr:uncharacterized protein M406DRAFT_325616 [Cryphonectria parasitica EP155]KAF3770156.1 hypothetical protein M406DRAFT_325616 [Cryphonectria parasitica EP155]
MLQENRDRDWYLSIYYILAFIIIIAREDLDKDFWTSPPSSGPSQDGILLPPAIQSALCAEGTSWYAGQHFDLICFQGDGLSFEVGKCMSYFLPQQRNPVTSHPSPYSAGGG